MDIENISRELLDNARKGLSLDSGVQHLSQINYKELNTFLSSDSIKKAFWINVYNAINIDLLRTNPDIIKTQRGRYLHFNYTYFFLVNKPISLNFIEHGLLRHSKIRLFKGYVNKLWVSKFERQLRVQIFDPRIHFALNYGATSCPPVRHYESKKIEKQLELTTLSFLDSKISYFAEENIVKISQLFYWYNGDFGGEKGIINFLRNYKKIPEDKVPMIIYNNYNWNPAVEILAG